MRYTAAQYAAAFLCAASEVGARSRDGLIDRFTTLLHKEGAWKRRDDILYQCRKMLAESGGPLPLEVAVARKQDVQIPEKIGGVVREAVVREHTALGAGAVVRFRDIRVDGTLRRRFEKIRTALA